MRLPAFFVRRPIFAWVIALFIILLGLIAIPQLPIARYPTVAPPMVSIYAVYPGATPQTMNDAVVGLIERELSSVKNLLYFESSTDTSGFAQITATFKPGTNPELAQVDVQNRIKTVEPRLPAVVRQNGLKFESAASSFLMFISLKSDDGRHSEVALNDYMARNMVEELRRVDGVGRVQLFGSEAAMRIWVDPAKLVAYKLSMSDLSDAVTQQNTQIAPGRVGGAPTVEGQRVTFPVSVQGQLTTPEQFAAIVLRANPDGSKVVLGDVARVALGAQSYGESNRENGKLAAALGVQMSPGANAVRTSAAVKARLAELAKTMPPGMSYSVPFDTAPFVQISIEKVAQTLLEAMLLVFLVMYLFLQNVRYTFIPAIVAPIALLGTFTVMLATGFSVNVLTMFGMVLAIGILVDDAIVVVENIHRHLEAGLGKREAAIKGAGEIGFTVVSISFSLVAAFIPLLFMGGVVGRLFKEFALTATSTILISVVVSLTLAPTLAALFMRAPTHPAHAKPGFSERLLAGYARNLRRALVHQRSMLAIFVVTLALAVVGYVFIPKGFFPVQDTGFVLGTSEAAADVSFPDMVAKHKALAEIIKADPAVATFSHSVGVTGSNQTIANGRFWIALKDRGDRDVSASQFIDRIRSKLAKVPGIVLYLRAGQDINLSSGPSRAQYQYVLKSNDGATLNTWTQRLTEKLRANPAFRDLSNDLQLGGSITHISIDRQAAARFGLTATDVDQALYDAFGQRQINEFQTEINQYQVVLELDTQQRGKAESLNYFYLRSPLTNEMVPLSALAKVDPPSVGPLSISHDGMFPAANLSFNLAPGVALGDAVIMLNQAKNEIGMPATILGNFQGAAQAFQSSLASQPWLILAALVAVYIILGVLYESFVHPLTIISTLPSAGLGALIMLWLLGQDFSIMALIGLVLLIGIVKKNGILMIDFALEAQRVRGLPPEEAIYEACVTRFRPIIMTTLAALLGAVPLMLGAGPGAELRQPLGIAVVGGLLVSQALTLFTTPIIYLYLERFFHRPTPTPALATTH